MALKQNIGTGGLYPTGIAPQALDFTQTQQAISQALISQKKEEIKQKKDLMSESEKAMLNAMSFEAVQGLADKAQQDHLKRYQDLSAKWTEVWKEGGGILSDPQRFQMEREKRQLDIDTSNMKYRIAQVQKAQSEYNAHPLNFDPQTLVNLKNIFDNGLQGLVDASNVLVPRDVPWTEYVDNSYKHEITGLDKKLNTAISTTNSREGKIAAIKQNIKETGDLYDTISKATPNLLKTKSGQLVSKDEFIKTYGTNLSVESINAGLLRSGGGSGPDKNARDYTPTPFEYKTDKYNIVQIPSDVAQADRNFFINKAKNKDTGEVVQLDQSKASLLGVDVDKGVILLQGVGAQAEKGGKPLYSKDGAAAKNTKGEWAGYTESDLKSEDVQKRLLESSLPAGTKADKIKNIDVAKNSDGSIIISGEIDLGYMGTKGIARGGWFGKNDTQPVEVTLKTFNDPSAQAVFEAPLGDNKPAVAVMFPKVRVRGVPLENYVDRAGTTTEKQNITEAEYAKLKPGDKYWFNGVEHIKQ